MKRFRSIKDESGFTLMETLCAIALLLICAGAAGGLAHSARRITGTIRERSVRQYRQLRIERIIREAAEEISVPYWAEETRGLTAAREAVEKALLEAGYKAGVELEALKDSGGRIRGINSRCRIDGQEYEAYGLFASVPLEREE